MPIKFFDRPENQDPVKNLVNDLRMYNKSISQEMIKDTFANKLKKPEGKSASAEDFAIQTQANIVRICVLLERKSLSDADNDELKNALNVVKSNIDAFKSIDTMKKLCEKLQNNEAWTRLESSILNPPSPPSPHR